MAPNGEKSSKKVVRSFKVLEEPSAEASKAAVILERAHDSVNALHRAFQLARLERGKPRFERGKPRGISTDEEQDLLRAMLVMAAAGLDSMLKQLIRDTVPVLVVGDERVRDGLEKFVARSIRGDPEGEAFSGTTFLAKVLTSASTQEVVIEQYITHLTGGSLQSAQELTRTASALGLQEVRIDHGALRPIFQARNKIIHELDINLDGDRRKRNHRGLEGMRNSARTLLDVGEQILCEVDKRVKQINGAG